MKVHLIRRQSIEAYMFQHAKSRASFQLWMSVLKQADWKDPAHITDSFGSADLLGNGSDRIVFDIAGNSYRMICKYHFGAHEIHLYVKWIGTHAEYSALCKKGKQYSISTY